MGNIRAVILVRDRILERPSGSPRAPSPARLPLHALLHHMLAPEEENPMMEV